MMDCMIVDVMKHTKVKGSKRYVSDPTHHIHLIDGLLTEATSKYLRKLITENRVLLLGFNEDIARTLLKEHRGDAPTILTNSTVSKISEHTEALLIPAPSKFIDWMSLKTFSIDVAIMNSAIYPIIYAKISNVCYLAMKESVDSLSDIIESYIDYDITHQLKLPRTKFIDYEDRGVKEHIWKSVIYQIKHYDHRFMCDPTRRELIEIPVAMPHHLTNRTIVDEVYVLAER